MSDRGSKCKLLSSEFVFTHAMESDERGRASFHATTPPRLLGNDVWFHTADTAPLLEQHAPYGFRDSVNASVLRAWQSAVAANMTRDVTTRRRSCAVVGSSGVMINASLGRRIDAADHVIRMNTAPTVGFEEHVGSKTTIRVATLNAGLHARREGLVTRSTTLVYYCQTKWIGACWGWIPREPAPRLSPSLLRVAQAVLRTSRLFPSTGIMSVLVAMSLCRKVSLYGFGLRNDTKCGKYYGRCVPPAMYFSHLSRKQIVMESKKQKHIMEVGGAYHDLESETSWLQSLGYRAPMAEHVKLAGFDAVSLRMEPWIDPRQAARVAKAAG